MSFVGRRPGAGIYLRLAIALLGLFALALGFRAPAAHAAGGTVLILDSTVSGGTSSREALAAQALGYSVQVVNGSQWDSMTTAQFASYAALILGDPTCGYPDGPVAAAVSNSSTWAAAVTGNVFVIGSDPTYHASYSAGAGTVIHDGVAFATGQAGATGAYITLSCYYVAAGYGTPVHVLDGFDNGAFSVEEAPGCFNNAHIVAASSALAGLSDADLSNWSCSVHEMFDTWSPGFQVLAIAKGAIAARGGSYVAPDGSTGQPYVLARGKSLAVVGNFTLGPTYDTKTVGQTETLTANLTLSGSPVAGTAVGFSVTSGPDKGATGNAVTDSSGNATFTLTGTGAGTDIVSATYTDSTGKSHPSNTASVVWSAPPAAATSLKVAAASGTYGGTVSLSATLTSGSTDLSSQSVAFTLNATSVGSATTDANGVATLSNVSLAGINAGTYPSAIGASFAATSGYLASNATGALTVSPATATVTLSDLNQTYDGSGKSAGVSTSPSGLAVTVSYSQGGTAVTNPTHAGSYAVTATVSDPNYAGSTTGTLVIAQAAPTLAWSAPADITYGTALSATQLDATASFNGSPLAGRFTYTPASGTVLNAGANQTLSAAFSPADSTDFAGGTVTTTLTVNRASLTVAANDATREYGAANPSFSGTLSGVVNGDDITANYGTSATASSSVGTYPITPALNDPDGRLANYSVTSTNGTLTITPAKTSTAVGNASATYGDTSVTLSASVKSDTGIAVTEGSVTFTVSQNGTAKGSIPGTVSNGAASASFPLTGYSGFNLDAGSYSVSASYSDGASPANFQGSAAGTSATLTVNKAALTVAAASATMIYGASLPTLSGTLTGVVSPDGITASYSTTATSSSPVGSYAITPSLSDPNNRLGNYNVTKTNGTLTVTPAHTSTTPAAVSLTYGVAKATLSATVANTDTTAAVNEGTVTFTLTSSAGSQVAQVSAAVSGGSASTSLSLAGIHAGSYTISASYGDGATPANFQASSGSATLALTYHFGGFLQPIPAPVQTFKTGSGLPVKFQVFDANGNPLSGAVASLSATVNGTSAPVASKGGANSGTSFRYDPSGQLYIYNLDTKGMATGTLVLTATLDDGTTHSVSVTLK